MKSLNNKVAVITGAGSGIGRALAVACAKEGSAVSISDWNAEGLAETESMLRALGAKVHSKKLDVSSREAIEAYALEVVDELGTAHLIVNNAGVSLSALVNEMSYEDFEWLMDINFWGVVYGTKTFLPILLEQNEGHIVNISSIFGIVGIPTQSAYNAAKFAVRGFTESLREELDITSDGVSCTSVHPGGIKTNIARNGRMGGMGDFELSKEHAAKRFDKMAKTTPEEAASCILNGVRKNKRRVLIGNDAKIIDAAQRMMPSAYQRIVAKAAKSRKLI